jgi:hypothetical protein
LSSPLGLGAAVLVAEVHLQPCDPVEEAVETLAQGGVDLLGEGRAALDVAIGVDLDLHGTTFLSESSMRVERVRRTEFRLSSVQ